MKRSYYLWFLLLTLAFLPWNTPQHAGAQEGVRVTQRQAYRNPRYVQRCRVEARRDAPESSTVEDRSEARSRAVLLARSRQLDPVLLLARIAYGESGTPQPGRNDDPRTPLVDEYEAFLAVMDSLRGQMSREEMMVRYAPRRVFPRAEDSRQRWVSEVQLDGSRPPSWPAPRNRRFHPHPGWRHYGCPRWLATVDAARAVLRAHPTDVGRGPCERQPDHWGGAMDDHRALRAGWRPVDCGTTLNNFWSVPPRAVASKL
jgi:hypothetical protein